MITDKIINTDFLDENLIKIIPSIIVVNTDMQISSISMEVAKLLYFQPEEVIGMDIMDIVQPSEFSFVNHISELKRNGYFGTQKVVLINKYNKEVLVEISGFYLGLLSESSSMIVLNVRDIDKLKTYQNLLNDKVTEFNELVYRTYHDLKGPIATLQGLINISQYNKTIEDYKSTIELFKSSTDLLNSRITNISAIFDANAKNEIKIDTTTIGSISLSLRKAINRHFPDKKVKLQFETQDMQDNDIDKDVIISFFSNIVMALKNSNPIQPEPLFKILIVGFHEVVQIKCEISGFDTDYSFFEKVLDHEFNFSQIINDEEILRIYILNNQVQKRDGNIHSSVHEETNSWTLNIILPKN